MVSEDSDQLMPGLAMIHRLSDLGDLDQTLSSPMSTSTDHLHAQRELLEVTLFRCAKPMLAEERNDRFHQSRTRVDDVLAQMLAVVVMPLVHVEPSHAEEALELLQTATATDSLGHDKPMRDLVPVL